MAEMRDLKADLAEKWLERALAEKERADFLESEVEEYSEKYLSLYRDFAAEKERSEQLESLVRELAEVLSLYEKWEADLLMDHSLWQSPSGLPFITQEVWDDLVAVQTERNKVLHKAKEVLGDGN